MNNRIRLCLMASLVLVAGCDNGSENTPDQTCTRGQTRCEGGVLQTCIAEKWQPTPCTSPMTCSDESGIAACKNPGEQETCTQGATRCNGAEMFKCDANKWNKVECNGTCVEANGTATCQTAEGCTAGAKKCEGSTLMTCNGTTWTPESCNGSCVEANGTAICEVAECEKGQIQCHDDGTEAVLWKCTDALKWDKSEKCPATDVENARLSCLNAESCSTIICPRDQVYSPKEKKCIEMSHSNDCVAGMTYCNYDENILYECLETSNDSPTTATDCAADGKVCVKVSDDKSECVAQECEGNFCEGETLKFCTDDHKIDPERINNCAENGNICDINEFGEGQCMPPECVNEGEIKCVADDDTHTKYVECVNKRWSDVKTCAAGIQCETIGGKGYCAECHADDEKCEDVDGKATHFTCSETYAWAKAECPEKKPVCDSDKKACTETPDICENGTVGAGEDCDGTDLGKANNKGDQACAFATGDKKATGTLACNAKGTEKACKFDTTGCNFCGNNTIDTEIGEQCDGSAEITKTCAELLPNSEGTVKCGADCQFDTSECSTNYKKVTAIYQDYDRYINDTNCKAQTGAPKATVDITGVVTSIDSKGFYIQACDNDDTRGIYIYLENTIDKPKDLAVGNVYSLKGGLVSNYNCTLQIKKGSGLTITASTKECKAEPADIKISNILTGMKGDYVGSLVVLKGEKAIAYRSQTMNDQISLDVPGGAAGWRLGKSGIGKEITVTNVAQNAMKSGQKYNVTGIVAYQENHMTIATRTKDDIVENTCVATCNDNQIKACNGDDLATSTVSCAEHLNMTDANAQAVCNKDGDECIIQCNKKYVLVGEKCESGYLETFNYTGETTLTETASNAQYKDGTFTSADTDLVWEYTKSKNALSSTSPIDSNGLMMNQNGTLTTSVPSGVKYITLQAVAATSGSGERNVKVIVESATNSNDKKECTLQIYGSQVHTMPKCEVNMSGEVKITIKNLGDKTNIDNIMWLSQN